MSTPNHGPSASPESLIEPTVCHTAQFATRWLHQSMVVVTAHGELDAANAQQFVDYALRHAAHTDRRRQRAKGSFPPIEPPSTS